MKFMAIVVVASLAFFSICVIWSLYNCSEISAIEYSEIDRRLAASWATDAMRSYYEVIIADGKITVAEEREFNRLNHDALDALVQKDAEKTMLRMKTKGAKK